MFVILKVGLCNKHFKNVLFEVNYENHRYIMVNTEVF